MADSSLAPSGLDAILREPKRAVATILVALVLFWTVFASLSRYNLDIHGDMVENFAWGLAGSSVITSIHRSIAGSARSG
jgi:hypothetical protein